MNSDRKTANHLAIIGASYLQLPLIEKAREMGYTTHVFAWAAQDVGEAAADFFYPVSIVEKEQIAGICREIGICGICSIASDLAAVTVNYVADQLGLTGNSPECTEITTNKYSMRIALQQGGDPIPAFCLIENEPEVPSVDSPVAANRNIPFSGLQLPLIIKPTDRSGSRGVTVLNSMDEFPDAVRNAMRESFEHRAILEEYFEGEEYSLEGISWNGRHQILAMTKKRTTGPPHFIETGHLQPAPVSPETFRRAEAVVLHALDTLKIRYGASHSEIRIAPDGRIKIIEIGARMGGDCIGSHLVPLTTGIDYVRAVIQIACGQAPDLQPYTEGVSAGVHYILQKEDELRMNAFRQTHPDRFLGLLFLHPEQYNKTTSSSDRPGCYLTLEEAPRSATGNPEEGEGDRTPEGIKGTEI